MTFTATVLADMVARGEVSLDDPVEAHIPEGVTIPSLSGYEMTLGHLSMHRSGLPAEPPAPYDAFTLDDLYGFLDDYRLDWVPGRSHEISTLGYGLLGHALAGAAGVPFAELLRARVLEPLGMTATGYGPDAGPALQGRSGLRSDDGHLTYQPSGRMRTPLFPASDSVFFMLRAPLTVTFDRVGDHMEVTMVTDRRAPASSGRSWTRWRVDRETPPPHVAAGNASPWAAWSATVWIQVGLVGAVALALILRPLWPRRATAR